MAEGWVFLSRLRVIKTEHDRGLGLARLSLYCTASLHSLSLRASKTPDCPSRFTQSHYIVLHLFVCQSEQRVI